MNNALLPNGVDPLLYCGGLDGAGAARAECWTLRPGGAAWEAGPPLLHPAAWAAGAVLGDTWYLAGGWAAGRVLDTLQVCPRFNKLARK